MAVSVYRLVLIWNSPQFPTQLEMANKTDTSVKLNGHLQLVPLFLYSY